MTEPATHATANTNRRRRGPKILLIVLTILAVTLVSAVAAIVLYGKGLGDSFDSKTTTIDNAFPAEDKRPPASVEGAQTILLLGSDTRANIDTDGTDDQPGLTDTIMVLRIPADRSGIYVMSIMRDSWVEIEGYGHAKINAAMPNGGVPLVVSTVENLIGTQIDHVAVIDFEGFRGMTDALGGVTVTNPEAFTTGTVQQQYSFPAGSIKLDGDEALAFVRERKSFASGDYQRVKNQQIYMRAVVNSLLSRGTLTNPGKMQEVVNEISPYLAVDDQLDSGYLLGLGPSMATIRPAGLAFFTMPTSGTDTSADGQSIVVVDEEAMVSVRKAFQEDVLADYIEGSK